MSSRYYVAIDDTDNLESRGTGHQARALAARLEQAGVGRCLGVTRHQLLVDPRIPYTSHNSSACLLVEAPGGSVERLVAESAAFLEEVAAPGSDAGLCVAEVSRVSTEIVAWGRSAKTVVLTQDAAHGLAARHGIHLSGHTGQRIGVIGALAAVGLRHEGADGRFLELGGLRQLKGIQPVSALTAAGITRFRCENSRGVPAAGDYVDVGEWCRPVLLQGEPTLLVEEVTEHESAAHWRIASKEHIKEF